MSAKNLSEADWKRFSKGRDYKDAALLKALAALDKAERAAPTAQVEALDELEKQAELLRKSNKADKELAAYLDELHKLTTKQRKASEQAAAAAEAEAEEEDTSPAVLGAKMIPLLRDARKGVVLKALVALAGPEAAVLVSRRAIGPSQRKLLVAELGGAGGIKYVVGECVFEANAHTFVVQSQAAGLAKKLKAALLRQTEQRYKVRVRGEDPADIDEDLEGADDAGEGPDVAAAAPSADAGAAFKARLTALLPAIQQAAAEQRPAGAQAKLKAAEAGALARDQRFDAALRLLDEVEALLKPGAAATTATPAAATIARDTATGIRPGTVDYAKCRLAWTAARKKVQEDLLRLEQTILAEFEGVQAYGELSQKIRKFDGVLAGFADDLDGALDDALNAVDDATRGRHHRLAAEMVARFVERANGDPFIAKLQNNPFVPVAVQPTLIATLDVLAKRLV